MGASGRSQVFGNVIDSRQRLEEDGSQPYGSKREADVQCESLQDDSFEYGYQMLEPRIHVLINEEPMIDINTTRQTVEYKLDELQLSPQTSSDAN